MKDKQDTVYEYDNPLDWLSSACKGWNLSTLRNAMLLLAEKCDMDDIQDIFQQEMEEDVYFIEQLDE